MRRVTVLLTGVPQYVTLKDLSYNLDQLFNTDEIGTFKLRNLPNHPVTNKRQIALDFLSGFDAMEAQQKLNGYQYELVNGNEYTLRAKINTIEEYMRSESLSPDRWDVNDSWLALKMIAKVSDEDMYKAHAKLDAQLELLKKQKLILDTEKEILREKRKLKREYGCMGEHDSEKDSYTSKRSKSRDNRSSSRPKRSRSRDLTLRAHGSRRSSERNSRSRDSKIPEIEWHHDWASKARSHSRERRSRSREIRPRHHRSKSRDPSELRSRISRRSRSKDLSHRSRRSASREREHRRRSRSKSEEQSLTVRRSRDRMRSASREREHRRRSRSRSEEHSLTVRRSRSRDRRRSNSREREHRRRSRPRSKEQSLIARRSRSRDSRRSASREREHKRRSRSRSEEQSLKVRRPTDLHEQDAHTPPIDNINIVIDTMKRKHTFKKDREASKGVLDDKATTEMEKEKHSKQKNKEKRKRAKCKKANKLARVNAISKDTMVLLLMLLDEIIVSNDIKISVMNKNLLDIRLAALVKDRVEPLATDENKTNDEILKKYMELYPKETDAAMLKLMLAQIPKLVLEEPQATVTSTDVAIHTTDIVATTNNSSVEDLVTPVQCKTEAMCLPKHSEQPQSVELANTESQRTSGLIEIIDMFSNDANEPAKDVAPSENNKENAPDNKAEIKKEDIVTIIDLDSAEKPVPRRPMFVLLIRKLSKDMNKVIKNNNLGEDIKLTDLKQVLRYIIKDLVKGKGYMTRMEIMEMFRGIYPKDKDLIFIKNIIKDIKEGKYPGLGPNDGVIGIAAENDCEDDVVLIEKHIDVVTVTDSDDDDVVKKPVEIIDLACATSPPTQKPATNNASLAYPIHVTPGPINLVPTDPSPRKSDPTNTSGPNRSPPLITARTMLVKRGDDMPLLDDFGLSSTGKSESGVANPGPTKPIPSYISPAEPNVPKNVQSAFPTQPCQFNLKPANRCLVTVPTNSVPINPGQLVPSPNPRSTNPVQGMPRLATQGVNPGLVNPSLVFPYTNPSHSHPFNPGQAKPGPAKPQISLDKQKATSSETQQLKSNEVKETAEKEKSSEKPDEVIDKLDKQEATEENSSNSLKVTAITITASLNDLIARTLSDETNVPDSNKPGEELIENIKQEIKYEDPDTAEEAVNSSKEPGSTKAPQVTSITIMTSEAELLSLGTDEGEKVNEIKSENILDHVEEESTIGINNETDSQNSAIRELEKAIAGSATRDVSTNNNPGDDEDETIESIVKYVNSLLQ